MVTSAVTTSLNVLMVLMKRIVVRFCAMKYDLAGTPYFPSSYPSPVYLADVHCIYKSNIITV